MVQRLTGRLHGREGFTLAEVLIGITILALLFILVLWNWRIQIARGHDATRKSDLARIRIAFEDYYNDYQCYPPVTILTNCDSTTAFAPYLVPIPCDPVTDLPYKYVPVDEGNLCKGYRVLATLYDTSDRAITNLGCNPITGCGWGAFYNWGVSQGASVAKEGFDASATPTLTPPTAPGSHACDPNGICNVYADPIGAGCPVTYQAVDCNNQCGNHANWCTNY